MFIWTSSALLQMKSKATERERRHRSWKDEEFQLEFQTRGFVHGLDFKDFVKGYS